MPVLASIRIGAMKCERMIERDRVEVFENLAIRRSNALYDLIDNSSGFYRTLVTSGACRSRMQAAFTSGATRAPRSAIGLRSQEQRKRSLRRTGPSKTSTRISSPCCSSSSRTPSPRSSCKTSVAHFLALDSRNSHGLLAERFDRQLQRLLPHPRYKRGFRSRMQVVFTSGAARAPTVS